MRLFLVFSLMLLVSSNVVASTNCMELVGPLDYSEQTCEWNTLNCRQWDNLPNNPYVYNGSYVCTWDDTGDVSRICTVEAYGSDKYGRSEVRTCEVVDVQILSENEHNQVLDDCLE